MAKRKKAVVKRTRTVYRDGNTGKIISKAKAAKLPKARVIVERTSTPHSKLAHTVYRNTVSGKLVTKKQADSLPANQVTIERMAGGVSTPKAAVLIPGSNIVLTGDWGTTPLLTVDSGSTDKRGTIRITPGENPGTAPGVLLTFAHVRARRPFAIVTGDRAHGGPTPYSSHSVTATGLQITAWGSLSPDIEIVYNYLVTE